MKKLIIIFISLQGFIIYGMELEQILKNSLENDSQIKILSITLENTLLDIERSNLDTGFSFGFSTGGTGVSYSFEPGPGDSPLVISSGPSISVGLGSPVGTEFGVDVPLFIDINEEASLTVTPEISIKQPLNDLLGIEESTELEALEDFYSIEEAKINLFNRLITVQKNVLTQIQDLYEMEKTLKELDIEISDAEKLLDEAHVLGIYSKDSSNLRQLEFNLKKLEREKEISVQKYEKEWKDLENIAGVGIAALPENIPEIHLELPGIERKESNPDIYLAGLNLKVEEARLKKEKQAVLPEFFLSGTYKMKVDDDKERKNDISGTFEGIFEDFSFSTSIGGVIETKTLYLYAGFSWSLPDKRIEEINIKEYENNIQISRIELVDAERDFLCSIEILGLELQELEYRKQNLMEDQILADLKLSESEKWYKQGLITEDELSMAHWESEKLDYEEKILRLDGLIAQKDLKAFIFSVEEM